MALPPAVTAHLRSRLGLITRSEVCSLGTPQSTLDHWLSNGELEVVERGVYRRPGTVAPPEQRVLAAVHRSGEAARATGWSACALFRLEGFELRARPWVAIPSARRVRGVDFIVQRTDLERCDLATVGGVPTVTPVRGLIDAAARVELRTARVGIDDDGRRWHTIDSDRAFDVTREGVLVADDWHVDRVRSDDLRDEGPLGAGCGRPGRDQKDLDAPLRTAIVSKGVPFAALGRPPDAA